MEDGQVLKHDHAGGLQGLAGKKARWLPTWIQLSVMSLDPSTSSTWSSRKMEPHSRPVHADFLLVSRKRGRVKSNCRHQLEKNRSVDITRTRVKLFLSFLCFLFHYLTVEYILYSTYILTNMQLPSNLSFNITFILFCCMICNEISMQYFLSDIFCRIRKCFLV